MKKNNKATPFLMILVLSIVATQLSLKAVGINITPSIGTVVQSWGKMASLIGGVYQTGFITELGTLSNHLLCNDGKVPAEAEKSCSELACNKVKDFEFELPPPIDVNDPSVTIEEPVQEPSLKAISRIISKREGEKATVLDVEVLEIAADADEDGSAAEPRAENGVETVRSIAVGIAVDEEEIETKPATLQPENRIFFFSDSEAAIAPKADKAKKPCPDVEKFKKLEEIKKLQEEFQLEPEWQFTEQTVPNFGVQALQASQSVEKPRRFRVIVKRNFTFLPLATPRAVNNESINFVNLAE
jgi:hypothetical protein